MRFKPRMEIWHRWTRHRLKLAHKLTGLQPATIERWRRLSLAYRLRIMRKIYGRFQNWP